jgi:BolA-like protein 1
MGLPCQPRCARRTWLLAHNAVRKGPGGSAEGEPRRALRTRYNRPVNRQERIERALADAFGPEQLVVENESHTHSVPKGSETHFKVLVVSEAFAGQGLVARQRRVNELLRGEFAEGLHALSLRLLTPEQWRAGAGEGFVSPACRGGSKAG